MSSSLMQNGTQQESLDLRENSASMKLPEMSDRGDDLGIGLGKRFGGFNGAAATGALLQRATSAPPVSDNVSVWALNGDIGNFQPMNPGNLDPDYMYYYYSNTLNPRLPRAIHPHNSSLENEEPSENNHLSLRSDDIISASNASFVGHRSSSPATQWDPSLEGFAPRKMSQNSKNVPFLESSSGLTSQPLTELDNDNFRLNGINMVNRSDGTGGYGNSLMASGSVDQLSGRNSALGGWNGHNDIDTTTTVDALGASLKELGLGREVGGPLRTQSYSSIPISGSSGSLYNRDATKERRNGANTLDGADFSTYEDPLLMRGGNSQNYGRPPSYDDNGFNEFQTRQYRVRSDQLPSNEYIRDGGELHNREMMSSRGHPDGMHRSIDGYYGHTPMYVDHMDGYQRMGYARLSPHSPYGEPVYVDGTSRYFPSLTPDGYGGDMGYMKGAYSDMDIYRNDSLLRDDFRDRTMMANRGSLRRDDRGGPYRDRRAGVKEDHRVPSRGTLLDEFRSSIGKGRKWDLEDLSGNIVQFCRDQYGSRFIQQKLEVATEAEKIAFFDEVLPHAQSLMTDVFGNYVIQKLFDHGGPDQRIALASFLVGHAVQLSLQMYGCRVVQKALEFASIDTLITLVSEFGGQVMKCVQDQNGNHVIQKCIEVACATAKDEGPYLHRHIQFIIDAFMGHVEKLSTHAYGCRVIQRILEHCIDAQRDPVLEEIRNSFGTLIQDQYGNYVIQHVLKHGRPSDRAMLMTEVRVNLLAYSQHKFASNVVEKCLQYGTREERGALIHHLTHGHADGQASLLQVMVCDPYANYVVQKIIDVADAEQREGIITEIRNHATQLKRYTFGKHIISRLEKISGKKM